MYHDFDYVGYENLGKKTPDQSKKKSNRSHSNQHKSMNTTTNRVDPESKNLNMYQHGGNSIPDIIKKGPINSKRDQKNVIGLAFQPQIQPLPYTRVAQQRGQYAIPDDESMVKLKILKKGKSSDGRQKRVPPNGASGNKVRQSQPNTAMKGIIYRMPAQG